METNHMDEQHNYKHWNDKCYCNWMEMTWSVAALLIVLLPGIVLKLSTAGSQSSVESAQALYTSPAFSVVTLVIGFALSIYAMARAGKNSPARTVALLALIVCILKFLAIS